MSELLQSLKTRTFELHLQYLSEKEPAARSPIMEDLRANLAVMCDAAQEDPGFFAPLEEATRARFDSMDDEELINFLSVWDASTSYLRAPRKEDLKKIVELYPDVRKVLDAVEGPAPPGFTSPISEERRQQIFAQALAAQASPMTTTIRMVDWGDD